MTATKRSIALVIREPGAADDGPLGCGPPPRWLLVRRPDDDEDLPGVWGLPAGSLEPGETDLDLVHRIGREKLGLEVEPGVAIASGSVQRSAYRLVMELWTATGAEREPSVSGGDDEAAGGRTIYSDWKWDDPSALEAGAREGSLCCRLGLEAARL